MNIVLGSLRIDEVRKTNNFATTKQISTTTDSTELESLQSSFLVYFVTKPAPKDPLPIKSCSPRLFHLNCGSE